VFAAGVGRGRPIDKLGLWGGESHGPRARRRRRRPCTWAWHRGRLGQAEKGIFSRESNQRRERRQEKKGQKKRRTNGKSTITPSLGLKGCSTRTPEGEGGFDFKEKKKTFSNREGTRRNNPKNLELTAGAHTRRRTRRGETSEGMGGLFVCDWVGGMGNFPRKGTGLPTGKTDRLLHNGGGGTLWKIQNQPRKERTGGTSPTNILLLEATVGVQGKEPKHPGHRFRGLVYLTLVVRTIHSPGLTTQKVAQGNTGKVDTNPYFKGSRTGEGGSSQGFRRVP